MNDGPEHDLDRQAAARRLGMARALRRRLVPYALALLAIYVLGLAAAIWGGYWLADEGRLLAGDFISFWTAGLLAGSGRAAEAYDWHILKQAQLALGAQEFEGFFAWHNPPSFFLFVVPFAQLSYPLAWIAWIGSTAAFFVLALRLILPGFLLPAALAAPATLWCAAAGQNGFLTAALMAGCLALLNRRPVLAGTLLGLLTVKPQFGLLFPFFLLALRRWRVFAAATATTLLLAAASALLFGAQAWVAFAASVTTTQGALAEGGAGWLKLQSAYALAFRLTGDTSLAVALHAAFALAVGGLLMRQWLGPTQPARQAAALVAAAYLVTPYAYVYDAVLLTTAAAFLVRDGLDRGFAPGEKRAIALALVLPAAHPALVMPTAFFSALVLLALALPPRDAARRPFRRRAAAD